MTKRPLKGPPLDLGCSRKVPRSVLEHSTVPSVACRRGDRLALKSGKASDTEEKEDPELCLDLVEEAWIEVDAEEGLDVGEDITFSFEDPCRCLSFRLRSLFIVLMFTRV